MKQSPTRTMDSLSCPQCGKHNFTSFGALRDHFTAKAHPFRCGKCHRDFKTVDGVLQHYQTHSRSSPSKVSKGTQTVQTDRLNQTIKATQAVQAAQAAQGSTTKKAVKSQAQKTRNASPSAMQTTKTPATPSRQEDTKGAEILPAGKLNQDVSLNLSDRSLISTL